MQGTDMPLRTRRSAIAVTALMMAMGCAAAGCSGHGGGSQAAAQSAAHTGSSPSQAESSAAPSPPDASATPPQVCSLLTEAEAERLAGMQLATGVQSGPDTGGMCQYTAPPTGATAQVEVFLGDGAKKILDIDRKLGHGIKPVAGLGDEAYEEDDNIFVRKGTVWIAVNLVLLNDASQNVTPLRTAAATITSRL
jgi:hypothetical protein